MAVIKSGYIFVDKNEEFRPHAIFECGQIFRYSVVDSVYTCISGDKLAKVVPCEAGWRIEAEDTDYFWNYFDFNTDYAAVRAELSRFDFLREGLWAGSGIRLLRQNHFETLISFIISANNHIPRIKGIIGRLCEALGQDMGGYYAFPTAMQMAQASEDFYFKIGAGYRAPYLAKTARAVAGGVDLAALDALPTDELTAALQKFMGVGAKVADCIALFSYARWDVFPVDTWIKKVYLDIFGKEETPAKIRRDFTSLIGKNCGLAQQYLFFNKRG